MPPQLRDQDDQVIQLLRHIAQNLSGADSGDISIEEGDTILDQAQVGDATYVTSGENGMAVEEEFTDIGWGFPARVVNVRFGHAILLAFDNPHDNPTNIIPLDPALDTSPFTIGDARGFGASGLWVKAQDSVDVPDDEPIIDFIAYQ